LDAGIAFGTSTTSTVYLSSRISLKSDHSNPQCIAQIREASEWAGS
jgi:hypothetical protein